MSPSFSLGVGLNISTKVRFGAAAPPFSPLSLFTSGEVGAWYEPSPSTCFTDTAGTTPAGVGDAVARINDSSGNGNHALQGTAAARPILRQTAGGLYYLEFDGVDDWIGTNLAVSTLNNTTVMALAPTWASNDRYWSYLIDPINDGLLNFNASSTTNQYIAGSRNPTNDPASPAYTLSNGVSYITTYIKDGTSDQKFRVDGSQVATSTNAVITFTSEELRLGSQLNAAYGEMSMFGFVGINRTLIAAEISNTETYLANRSGVTL